MNKHIQIKSVIFLMVILVGIVFVLVAYHGKGGDAEHEELNPLRDWIRGTPEKRLAIAKGYLNEKILIGLKDNELRRLLGEPSKYDVIRGGKRARWHIGIIFVETPHDMYLSVIFKGGEVVTEVLLEDVS